MNRDKQMAKDAENKQAQARENYAKNKTLLSEYRVKEKTTDYTPKETDSAIQEKKEKIARDKVSE